MMFLKIFFYLYCTFSNVNLVDDSVKGLTVCVRVRAHMCVHILARTRHASFVTGKKAGGSCTGL